MQKLCELPVSKLPDQTIFEEEHNCMSWVYISDVCRKGNCLTITDEDLQVFLR